MASATADAGRDSPIAARGASAPPTRAERLGPTGPALIGALAAGARFRDLLAGSLRPIATLGARLWLALLFLSLDGQAAAEALDQALFGMAPSLGGLVHGLADNLAALAALTAVGAGLLLLIGLFTRPAALALTALTIGGAVLAAPVRETLLAAALLLYIVVFGPGMLSLDRLFHRGAAASPIRLFAIGTRAYAWITRRLGPLYLLALRLWIAAVVVAAAAPDIAPPDLARLVGLDALRLSYGDIALIGLGAQSGAASELARQSAAVLALALAAGFLTRIAALALLALSLAAPITPLSPDALVGWSLALALIAARGAGPLSLDRALLVLGRWIAPLAVDGPRHGDARLPHVVIGGAGFAGVAAAKALRHAPVRVTLIDRRNYHLFQPLLYQVATAGLSPADIATPIREIFRGQKNLKVHLGRISDVDAEARRVSVDGRMLSYDALILATGARHSYFGRDDWEPFAPGLKKIDDATEIRRRILLAFERAEQAETEAERRACLTFVIVGGGPTGVEMAGAVAELARTGLAGEFRSAEPETARVLLVDGGDRALRAFPERLSHRTAEALGQLGVELVLNARVVGVDAQGVTLARKAADGAAPTEERIAAATTVWAAGVIASPVAKWLRVDADRLGRVAVDAQLRVPGRPEIHVAGDCALSSSWGGAPAPGLAPAAKQAGAHAAKAALRRLAGRREPKPFAYRHIGSLATIGRAAAVADFGRLRLSGAAAWWLWGAVHVLFLNTTRSRLSVALEWAYAYVTYRRSTRLITGGGEEQEPTPPAAPAGERATLTAAATTPA